MHNFFLNVLKKKKEEEEEFSNQQLLILKGSFIRKSYYIGRFIF